MHKLWMIMLIGLLACQQVADQDDKKIDESSEEASDDEVAVAPADITGVFLTAAIECQFVNELVLGCNGLAISGDGSKQPLGAVATLGDWSFETNHPEIEVQQNPSESFDIEFAFSTASSEDVVQLVLDGYVALEYTRFGSDQVETVRELVKRVIFELQSHRYFKLVINSVLSSDPSLPIHPLTDLELLIDDNWIRVDIDLLTPSAAGPYTITFSGSLTDALMLNTLYSGEIFEFNDDSSFSSNPPHDYKEKPLELMFLSNDGEQKLQGFRINGGEDLTGLNLPTGTPDDIQFEVSDDGDSWLLVPGSRVVRDENVGTFENILSNGHL